MSRAIIAIMSIVVIGALGVWGLQAAAANAGVNHAIQDESFTPNAGNVTTLAHSNLDHTYYDESVTVHDNNGDLMDPQNDYVWYDSNGTIRTVVGGDLDGATSATIDYRYQTTTNDQQALITVVGMLPRVLGVVLPLLGLAMLFVIMKG